MASLPEANIGTLDRVLRAIVDVLMGAQTPWGWSGVLPLLTALVSWCPAYVPFGSSACRKDRAARGAPIFP